MQFEVADATKRTFPEGSFDVVYSRDTILHIDDKLALFRRFHVSPMNQSKLLMDRFCFQTVTYLSDITAYLN